MKRGGHHLVRHRRFRSHFFIAVILLGTIGTAAARWRYYDDHGHPHEVDTESQVPGKYRRQAVDLDPDPLPETAARSQNSPGGLPGVVSKSGDQFEKVLPFSLPRLPTPSEIFAVRMAAKTPEVSGPLLETRYQVGANTWTSGAVVAGLFLGGLAFFLVERFSRTSPVFKVAVIGIATALIVADLAISAYASRLESAVALFNVSRKLRGGVISVSSVAPPGSGNGGIISGSGDVPVAGEAVKGPGGSQGRRPGQWDFQEVLRTLQEQLEASTTNRAGPADIPAR